MRNIIEIRVSVAACPRADLVLFLTSTPPPGQRDFERADALSV
jgi:hypothetical protein